MLETYMNRMQYQDSFPNIMSLNILEFVSKYSLSQTEHARRTNEVVVKTFPAYNSDLKGKNYGLYCKYQLLKFKPWQTHPHNAWNNLPECDETFIFTCLSTDYAKQHVATLAEELHGIEQYEALQLSRGSGTDPSENTQE